MNYIVQSISGEIRLVSGPNGYVQESTLETSILLSIFSDARASAEEIPEGESGARGWWGDQIAEVEGDEWGSKLWTLDRSVITNETLAKAEMFITESLQWMIQDAVASSISVALESSETNINEICGTISITRPSGTSLRYGLQWDEQEAKLRRAA